MSGKFYHPELDVLRFGAFLLVFVGHGGFDTAKASAMQPSVTKDLELAISGAGLSGVSLFFTLSAYLITELLLQEREKTGTVHLRSFYMRRILRIWPLYFVFLLIIRPLVAHLLPHEHFSGLYLAAFMLLTGNWISAFHGWPESVAAPLWSISVEEQFYLFWPFAVSRLRVSLIASASAMLVIANLTRIWFVVHPRPEPFLWAATLSRLDPFAVGALVAVFLHGRVLQLGRAARVGGVLLGVGVLLLIGRYGAHSGPRALFFYPAEAVAAGLLLLAVIRPMGSWTVGPIGRALVYLGRISYGLYVFHLMFLELVPAVTGLRLRQATPLAFVMTIATASLSYKWLEVPFLKLKKRFTFVPSRM